MVGDIRFHARRIAPFLGLILLPALLAGCPSWVIPVISVSPTAVSFDDSKADATLVVANAGGGVLSWKVQSKPDWISCDPAQGTVVFNSNVITVNATLAGLSAGTHNGQVLITSSGGNRAIAVAATVVAPPAIEVAPASLDFGGSAVTQTFTITNPGGSLLTWTIIPPLSNWLSVNPATGQTAAGESDSITVVVDRSGLAPGTQVGPVLIELNSNAGSRVVTVQATVQAFTVNPTVLDFGSQLDSLPIVLHNTEDDDVHWTINGSALPAWVRLTPDALSGTLVSGVDQTIQVAVDRTGLPPGVNNGEIAFASDGGPETVRLRVEGLEPKLVVTPDAIDFGSSKDEDTVTIHNNGTGVLLWSVEEGTTSGGVFTAGELPWLAVTGATLGQIAAGDSAPVAIQVDRSLVSPNPNDPYQGSLRFKSADGQESLVAISMVALPSVLRVLPSTLAFGTAYTQKTLAIWNGGLGTVNWRVDTSSKPAWVTVDPVDGSGIASGSVTGDETDAIKVAVDRTGLPPADADYAWSFQVTATNDSGNTLAPITVNVTMNVAKVPTISVDTGHSSDGTPNVDQTGVAFIPMGTTLTQSTFRILNVGTGVLSWSIDTNAFPSWFKSASPAQGAIPAGGQTMVSVAVDRAGLPFGDESYLLQIASNDPLHASLPVRLEMQVPKVVIIGAKPTEDALGLYAVSDTVSVANLGDPGSILNFQITSNKAWLYFYPETGSSEGTNDLVKDWRDIDISIDRGQLDGTGSTGELTITAFETNELGQRVTLVDVKPVTVKVSVQAAELSFEAPTLRTRIPSLVRFVALMRDIAYEPIKLPDNLLDQYANSFSIFEKDVPLEKTETNQFLTSGSNLRTNVAILLDYSGSMDAAAKSVSDTSISGATDPLQALYERCVGTLVESLPAHYNIALMEFHERSQQTRLVADGGPAFTTDKALVLDRLHGISIHDHGATELLPAVNEAGLLIDSTDSGLLRTAFDDADVRALICISDGRLTTPPGVIKDSLDLLKGLRVRFFPIGWGAGVQHEPLARIGSGTGGHYYPTAMERTGDIDLNGNPVTLPQVSALFDWCDAQDPAVAPCDQSVAKDLSSQIVLSYVTLTEDSPITVRVDAQFDNPNDDNGVCLPDQGLITGSLTQKQLDFTQNVGDIRMGQISLRAEGLANSRARAVVRAEYVPRNVAAFEFQITASQPFNAPTLAGGVVSDWTLTDLGSQIYRLEPPSGGSPLPYGAFGDLLFLEFTDAIPAGGATLTFTVKDPVYDASNSQGKYFIAPGVLNVDSAGSFAPAFPTPEVIVLDPPSTSGIDFDTGLSSAQIAIRNAGGVHLPTDVWLNWTVSGSPDFAIVGIPSSGSLKDSTAQDVLTVSVDRSVVKGNHSGYITIAFDTETLGLPTTFMQIPVSLTVLPPVLDVVSDSFHGGMTLDFGTTDTELSFYIHNAGQSTINWRANATAFPAWLSITPTGGVDSPDPVTVRVNRAGLATGDYTFPIQIQSNGGSATVAVTMNVP